MVYLILIFFLLSLASGMHGKQACEDGAGYEEEEKHNKSIIP